VSDDSKVAHFITTRTRRGRGGGGGEREEVSTFFPLNVGNSIAKILNSRRKRRKRKRMDIAVSPEKRREVEQQRG